VIYLKDNELILYQGSEGITANAVIPSDESMFEDYLNEALGTLKNRNLTFYPTISEVIEEIDELISQQEAAGGFLDWNDPWNDTPVECCEVCRVYKFDEELAKWHKSLIGIPDYNSKAAVCGNAFNNEVCPYKRELFDFYFDFVNSELLDEEFMAKYFCQEKIPFLDNKKGIINNPQLSLWE
jgi:hypothetical protein